jgi:hypothetical protein
VQLAVSTDPNKRLWKTTVQAPAKFKPPALSRAAPLFGDGTLEIVRADATLSQRASIVSTPALTQNLRQHTAERANVQRRYSHHRSVDVGLTTGECSGSHPADALRGFKVSHGNAQSNSDQVSPMLPPPHSPQDQPRFPRADSAD